MSRLTATEAGRNFSDLLDRVAGEEVEIVRHGATVALICPPRHHLLSAREFRGLLASASPVDDRFVGDLQRIRREACAP
jgi:prevent-host-death family protein